MPVPLVRIFEVGDYDGQIAAATELLRKDGVVVLPTETVYGAAARLTSEKGMARLREIRGATAQPKPFTVHLAHRDDARNYIGPVNAFGDRLMKKLWPGPVGLTFEVSEERRREV